MFYLVCVMLVLFPAASAQGAREGLKLAFNSVLPSLLPFAVFSTAVIQSGASRVLSSFASRAFVRLFNLPPVGATAFITGLFGGYPSGVKAICDMGEKGEITQDEAEKLLSFCNNPGIVFMVSVVGIGAFGSAARGAELYIAIVISSILTGVMMRGGGARYERLCVRDEIKAYRNGKKSSALVLGKSVSSSALAMANVVSAIVVFNSVIEAFSLTRYPLLCGIVEMTRGVFLAGEAKNLPLAAFFAAWGGISVHAQSSAVVSALELDMKKYFIGKALGAILAFVITYSFVLFEKGEAVFGSVILLAALLPAAAGFFKKQNAAEKSAAQRV